VVKQGNRKNGSRHMISEKKWEESGMGFGTESTEKQTEPRKIPIPEDETQQSQRSQNI